MSCALFGLIWSLMMPAFDLGAPPVCEVISVGTPKPIGAAPDSARRR